MRAMRRRFTFVCLAFLEDTLADLEAILDEVGAGRPSNGSRWLRPDGLVCPLIVAIPTIMSAVIAFPARSARPIVSPGSITPVPVAAGARLRGHGEPRLVHLVNCSICRPGSNFGGGRSR